MRAGQVQKTQEKRPSMARQSSAIRPSGPKDVKCLCPPGWRSSTPLPCWQATSLNSAPSCSGHAGASRQAHQVPRAITCGVFDDENRCDLLHNAAQSLARADVPAQIAAGLHLGRLRGVFGHWLWAAFLTGWSRTRSPSNWAGTEALARALRSAHAGHVIICGRLHQGHHVHPCQQARSTSSGHCHERISQEPPTPTVNGMQAPADWASKRPARAAKVAHGT